MAQLHAYAAQPRSPKARPWTVDELLSLLDPAVPVTAIMDRLGVARHIVTFELIRLRRAGFPVPRRPGNWARSPRSLAIEEDLRAGMTGAEVARRHGVTEARVSDIRTRAGIPKRQWAWTDDERALVIAYQDRPTREVAALVGRTVRAVDTERSRLIAGGRIRPKIARPRRKLG